MGAASAPKDALKNVLPVQAGIQNTSIILDPRVRGGDGIEVIQRFSKLIKRLCPSGSLYVHTPAIVGQALATARSASAVLPIALLTVP